MATLTRKRKLEELAAIVERYSALESSSRQVAEGALSYEGPISIGDETRHVRLTLPAAYPLVPPLVHEIDPETGEPVADEGRPRRLGPHGICLFPHGNDTQAWQPETGRAVDALDRFREFIGREDSTTQLFRSPTQVIIPPPVVHKLLAEGPGLLVCRQKQASTQLFAAELRLAREPGTPYPIAEFPAAWRAMMTLETAVPWLIVTSDVPWEQLIGSREALDATLRASTSAAFYQALGDYPRLLLVRQSQVGSDERVDLCCVEHRPQDPRSVLVAEVLRSTADELLFNRVDGAMTQRAALSGETVIMIGLGSLGSMTATALAQAGVRRFVLIDAETLALENVCRHIGGVADIGRAKVEVVGDAIRASNPGAEVTRLQRWLAWDLDYLSAGRELRELLASGAPCTIVSTCASGGTELQLNALALHHNTPAIYAAALGAADHGRIFRVIPGQSPCLRCILTAQDAAPEDFPRYIAPGLTGERPPAYLQPGLPGLAIDIGQLALLTARFTLQTIAKVRGIDLRLPPEGGDHLLWTNRGGWGFDCPLQLRVEEFPKDPTCTVCGVPPTEQALTAAQDEQLSQLEQRLSAKVD